MTPPFWIGLATGLFFLLFNETRLARSLENQIFDTFTQLTANPAKWPDQVVLVMVDEDSLKAMNSKYGYRWPWPRTAFAALTASLYRNGARTIVFDILFPEASEDAMDDDRFATYIKAAGNVWLAAEHRPDGLPLVPTKPLMEAVTPRLPGGWERGQWGWANVDKDPDGVIRRYEHQKISKLAEDLSGFFHGPYLSHSILLRWHATYQQLSDQGHAFSASRFLADGYKIVDQASTRKGFDEFDPQNISTLIHQAPPSPDLEKWVGNKIVFVGCSAQGTSDAIATPLNGHQPGALFQATAFENLLHGRCLHEAQPWEKRFLMILTLGIVTLICVGANQVRWQAFLTFLSLGTVFLFSFFLFHPGAWLPPLSSILAGGFCFTGITAYNYFVESKRRRFLGQLFSDFVSPDVLAEIQENPETLKLIGERRQGTVLFCDLEGFTTFSATNSSERVFTVINAYLSEASKALLEHGAYIDKFIGDAIMAVFGVPKVQPDHALKACLAALELRKMMMGLNERLEKNYKLRLGLRTGVNSGEMKAGAMGFARKLNYSVLGDTVNLASRLEGANKAYHTRIMIGPQTYEQARDGIEARFLDLLRVKGEVRAFPVYELLGRKGEISTETATLRDAYEKGFEAYRQKKWDAALKTFVTALEINKEDGPTLILQERCHRYKATPPLPDWDGSFSLDSK